MTAARRLPYQVFEIAPFWCPPEVPFYLASKDIRLGRVVQATGPVSRETMPTILPALIYGILGICGHRTAEHSAELMNALVKEVASGQFGEFNSRAIKAVSQERFMELGISAEEVSTLIQLSEQVERELPAREELLNMDGKLLVELLSQLSGVTPYLASMVMIFSLNRLDVFCTEDPELMRGILIAHGRRNLTPKFLESLRGRIFPFASVASLYYWQIAREARVHDRSYTLSGADFLCPAPCGAPMRTRKRSPDKTR